jgi:hypothetical protein
VYYILQWLCWYNHSGYSAYKWSNGYSNGSSIIGRSWYALNACGNEEKVLYSDCLSVLKPTWNYRWYYFIRIDDRLIQKLWRRTCRVCQYSFFDILYLYSTDTLTLLMILVAYSAKLMSIQLLCETAINVSSNVYQCQCSNTSQCQWLCLWPAKCHLSSAGLAYIQLSDSMCVRNVKMTMCGLWL